MNLSDLPAFEPDINTLKKDLEKYCEQYAISKFEADDIVELLEDGEEVQWIVEQLKQDNAELDIEKLNSILIPIHSAVAPPPDEDEEVVDAEIIDEISGEELSEEEMPPMDMSQMDLSQMGGELEAMTGMKLPDGFDMKQVQKMMEGPQGKVMADFAAWCQEQGVDMGSISDQKQIQELNEQYMQTPRDAFDGKTPAEASDGDPSMMGLKKVETFRREQPKVGRNDPCPCGSGKKYKKCCGKAK